MELTDSIAQSAFAGVIAGLTVSIILGSAKFTQQCAARRQAVKDLRLLFTQSRKIVIQAKERFVESTTTKIPEDTLRSARYNVMLKELDIVLEKWSAALSNHQRQEIYDALDWYNLDAFQVGHDEFLKVTLTISPEGEFPGDMSARIAEQKFKNLESIKWLRIKYN